jgi:hypothetical protein
MVERFTNPPRFVDAWLINYAAARSVHCWRKQAHALERAARMHLEGLRRRYGDVDPRLVPYRCSYCRALH